MSNPGLNSVVLCRGVRPIALTMPRMVLLQHELPDGSTHFDWLIEPVVPAVTLGPSQAPDPNERCLLSFRVLDRIDRPIVETFPADPLPAHRRHYLTFEGQLSPKNGAQRGSVRRVARGQVYDLSVATGLIVVVGAFFGRDRFVWTGSPDGDLWTFVRSRRPVPTKRSPEEEAYWREDLDRMGGEV